MSINVTVLGASSATPTSIAYTTAQIVQVGEAVFMIDCGEGAQQQLRRSKTRFSKINHIFISHLHGDHFFGLVGLLSSFHLLGRTTPLTIFGPEKLKEVILTQFRASGTFTSYPINFKVTTADKPRVLVETDAFKVSSFPLKHRIPTTGFLVEECAKPRKLNKAAADQHNIPICDYHWIKAGKDWTTADGAVVPNEELTFDPARPVSYAFASDTAYASETATYVRGVDLLYHESTFCKDKEERAAATMHSTAQQAGKVAQEAKAGALLLGHYSARYPKKSHFAEEAAQEFSKVILAKELWQYIITEEGVEQVDPHHEHENNN